MVSRLRNYPNRLGFSLTIELNIEICTNAHTTILPLRLSISRVGLRSDGSEEEYGFGKVGSRRNNNRRVSLKQLSSCDGSKVALIGSLKMFQEPTHGAFSSYLNIGLTLHVQIRRICI